jgi:MFS family permease
LPRLIDKDRLTEKEGLLGAIYNSAWVIGPLIGGVIAAKYGIGTTFLAAAGVSILAFLVLPIFGMPRASVDEAISNPLAGIKHFIKKRWRVQTYINALGLEFIYGSWFLTTLYLKDKGLSLAQIGLVTAVVSLPWVIFEIPIGKIAGRKIKEIRLFQLGFATIAAMMVLMGFVDDVWLFTGCYFLAVVGSCFIEQTCTPFFVKKLDQADGHLLSVFLTRAPIGRLLAPLVASLLLTFLPLNLVVSAFGVIAVLFFVNALLIPKS